MQAPIRAAYVRYYSTLFDRFEQAQPTASHRGRPLTYAQRLLIIFFTCMLLRRITEFKAQQRWLTTHTHPADAQQLGFTAIPHRTTLMRRYKGLAPTVAAFITFVGEWAAPIDAACASDVLVVDGRLFKARGPVGHQRDRDQGRVPEQLRTLDQDASWGKSGYHGWVYGYRLHFTCNLTGFPKAVQVTTASTAESRCWTSTSTCCWSGSRRRWSGTTASARRRAFGGGPSRASCWRRPRVPGAKAATRGPIIACSSNRRWHAGCTHDARRLKRCLTCCGTCWAPKGGKSSCR